MTTTAVEEVTPATRELQICGLTFTYADPEFSEKTGYTTSVWRWLDSPLIEILWERRRGPLEGFWSYRFLGHKAPLKWALFSEMVKSLEGRVAATVSMCAQLYGWMGARSNHHGY